MKVTQSYLESVESTSNAAMQTELFGSKQVSNVQVTWANTRRAGAGAPGGVVLGGSTTGIDVALAYKAGGEHRKTYLYLPAFQPFDGPIEITEARCEIKEWNRRLHGLTAKQVDAMLGEPQRTNWLGRRFYETSYGAQRMLLEVRFRGGVVSGVRFV